jgi:hypothetical protein
MISLIMICVLSPNSNCSITLKIDKDVDDVHNTTPCMAYPPESYSKTVGVRVGLESSLSEGRLSGPCRLYTEITKNTETEQPENRLFTAYVIVVIELSSLSPSAIQFFANCDSANMNFLQEVRLTLFSV